MISVSQIAWIAGLLEGEGYFAYRAKHGLIIQVTMVDADVIKKLHAILGFGSRKQRTLPSGKIAVTWTSGTQPDAAGLMMTILPFMGERRAAKIMLCLAEWKNRKLPRRQWTECSHGHPLTGDNLLRVIEGKYIKRRCRRCGVLRQQKYRSAA